MFADDLLKKAIQQIPGELSLEEMDTMVAMIEKYPDVFMKLTTEFKDKVATGKTKEEAATEVINSHQTELHALEEQSL